MISRYGDPHNCASTAIAKDHPKLDSDMITGIIADLDPNKADIPILLVVETVDGMFLYDKYKHSLLIAMGQDENRNNVSIAFVLAEGKTESTWSWFLWRLREHVAKDREVCLISDRGTGLLAALDNPGTGHEYTHRVWERRLAAIRTLNKDVDSLSSSHDGAGADDIVQDLKIARICKVTLRNENLENLRWRNPTTSRNGGLIGAVGFTWVGGCSTTGSSNNSVFLAPMYWLHVRMLRTRRPRSSRIRNEMDWKELGNKPKCSLCRVEGHTKKKCPNKKLMQP
ncbi:uncharacterized protein G2W53_018505 [Senna tora]|uniref:MULE transposase domain-containing protein n=1 Tax=Senna tora TaxID=362788 RepID=A0A834TV85_9FABA|nr:uncharacterized protein G2W53_018505 [Senna tora]